MIFTLTVHVSIYNVGPINGVLTTVTWKVCNGQTRFGMLHGKLDMQGFFDRNVKNNKELFFRS